MSYASEVLASAEKKYADQPEFLQAMREVFESLEPVISKNEERYRKEALLERRIVRFSSVFRGWMITVRCG